MIGHHPDKFGGHSQCDSGDIMFLLVEEQQTICSLKSAITIYFLNTWYVQRDIMYHTMLKVRHWSRASTVKIERKCTKKRCQSVQICYREKRKQKLIVIATLLSLNVNAIDAVLNDQINFKTLMLFFWWKHVFSKFIYQTEWVAAHFCGEKYNLLPYHPNMKVKQQQTLCWTAILCEMTHSNFYLEFLEFAALISDIADFYKMLIE